METLYILTFVLTTTLSAHAQMWYGAGDTRIVEYSSVFCQSLEAVYNTRDSTIGPSTLYVLSERPTLSDSESFHLNISGNQSVQYGYHFYEGSRISVDICINEDNYTSPRYLYLLNQNHSLSSSNSHSETVKLSIKYLNITELCSNGRQRFNYSILTEGEYYLLIRGYSQDNITISANMLFVRTMYHIPDDTIINSCRLESVFGSICSVSIPLSTNYGLLVYGNSSDSPDQWDKDIRIDITCSARVWLYAVIIVPSVLLLCVVVIVIVGCIFAKRRRSQGYRSELRAPLLRGKWEKPSEKTRLSGPTEKRLMYDKLTEMAITADTDSNPHIVSANPNPPPSFSDRAMSPTYGSPTFSTFKPKKNSD